MISLEQIPTYYYLFGTFIFIITILAYFKKLISLNNIKQLLYFIKRQYVLLKLSPRLWKIGNENLKNYSSKIVFNPYKAYINEKYSPSSPFLGVMCYIENYSIFDFKIKNIFMKIFFQHDNSELGEINSDEEIELPSQKKMSTELRLHSLHPNFTKMAKKFKEECKPLKITLWDIKVNVDNNPEFNYGSSTLEIPLSEIHIS